MRLVLTQRAVGGPRENAAAPRASLSHTLLVAASVWRSFSLAQLQFGPHTPCLSPRLFEGWGPARLGAAMEVTPKKQRVLAPVKTPDKVFACCINVDQKCNQCKFQVWCKSHKDVVAIRKGCGGLTPQRWLDLDPADGTVYCRVCDSFGTSQFKSQVSIRNLAHAAKRHARCSAHQEAVGQCLGSSSEGGGLTPPSEHFTDVWDSACKGDRAGSGLPHTGKRERTDKLLWCIHEAICREDQYFLRRADVITLVRDARKGRLLVRFIAVAGLDRHSGVLGQAKMFGTTSEDVTRATLDMIHKFCQVVGDPPRKQRKGTWSSAVDLQLEAHILEHIEAITVDSASDELLACEMMRGCGGMTPQSTPNLKCIIRDATHSARRVTSKPEKADPFLQEIHNKLISSKASISQILHNSTTLWGPRFAARIKELDNHVGLEVRNVRACKHRHESFAKPAGRFVLYLDAYLAVAEEMVASSSAVKNQAGDFLEFLSTEVLVQAAMLADAADECLLFTRQLDDEDTDSAKLNDEVAEYLDRLQCLFTDGQCVSLPGYTSFMLTNLERSTRAVRVGNGTIITLGCPHGVPRSIINQCLARMGSFTVVAKEVLEAEFPSYDLNRAFCIFNLASSGGGLTPHSSMPEEVSSNFRRLAQAFNVDVFELVGQYNDHLPMARRVKMLTNSSNQDAWSAALHKTQRHSKSSHPAGALFPVLQRYLCYTVSTAKVEQSFSKLKRVMGEQCLGGSATFEARLAKVVLDRTGTSKDNSRIQRARELWAEHWSTCRRPYSERLDKGVARPHRRHGERQWVRVRRDVVGRVAARRRRADTEDGLTSAVDAGGLTPAHCKVIEKQRQKGAKRKASALLEGTLLPEEQEDALEDAATEKVNMCKRAKQRLAATVKQHGLCSAPVSIDVLRGLPVFLEAGGLTPALTATLTRLACNIVPDRTMAKVIIVKDLSDLGVRTKWCTALGGNYVTTACALELGRGPILLYHEGRHGVRRSIWLSPSFKERHPKVVGILQSLAFSTEAVEHGSQWTLQVSEQPRTKGALVLMRKDEDEKTVAPKGNRCYDVEGFFGLIAKVRALYKLKVGK